MGLQFSDLLKEISCYEQKKYQKCAVWKMTEGRLCCCTLKASKK